jgi:hypothetical protein
MEETETKNKTIKFKLDGEDVETGEKELTVEAIIKLGPEDPATHYLQLVHGGKPGADYKDLAETIKLHEGIEFVTVYNGPTHVS